jgi:uncharacterized protein
MDPKDPRSDVGEKLGSISRSGKDVAAVLRDHRNYIHPEKERAQARRSESESMRLVLDANVLVAALVAPAGPPHVLFDAFLSDRFVLITSHAQLEEFSLVTRYPAIRSQILPAQAANMLNAVRSLSVLLEKLPQASVSRDPHDDYLFSMAKAGRADYLVTGDKAGVLAVRKYERTRVVTAQKMVAILKL